MVYWTIPDNNYVIAVLVGMCRLDPTNDNVDVEVRFDSGERYLATFFTIENIQYLMNSYKETGECKAGLYFWASDMIVVERLTEETIRETIAGLIATGEIDHALTKVDEDND